MDLGIASFAAITVVAYLIGYIWKTADTLNDKWIPAVCGISGCVLGIIAFLIKVPDFPAQDYLNAAAVGIVSGFAATGINQIYKQLTKDKPAAIVEPEPETAEVAEETSETTEATTTESIDDSADTSQ